MAPSRVTRDPALIDLLGELVTRTDLEPVEECLLPNRIDMDDEFEFRVEGDLLCVRALGRYMTGAESVWRRVS